MRKPERNLRLLAILPLLLLAIPGLPAEAAPLRPALGGQFGMFGDTPVLLGSAGLWFYDTALVELGIPVGKLHYYSPLFLDAKLYLGAREFETGRLRAFLGAAAMLVGQMFPAEVGAFGGLELSFPNFSLFAEVGLGETILCCPGSAPWPFAALGVRADLSVANA